MRWFTSTVLIGAAALATSCGDGPTVPASDSDVVAAHPTSASDTEGLSSVLRYEAAACPGPDTRGTGFLCESKDPVVRYFVSHYQADDIFFCGGSSFFELWDVQEKATGNGTNYHSKLADAPIFIYDWDALIAAAQAGELCDHVANGWVYRGTHDMVMNEVVRADGSFRAHWTGQGFVDDRDGNRYRYREHAVETDEGFSRQTVSVE